MVSMNNYESNKSSIEDQSLPPISVVIIGLNVEKYLQDCIRAVKTSSYPSKLLEVIYVDSGSKDNSVEIAKSFGDVKIIPGLKGKPNAAKARNAGMNLAKNKIIQFVDADSYLHPEWLSSAINYIKNDVVAVSGILWERFPDRNWYHRMADLEWNLQKGTDGWTTGEMKARTFGGNVMVLKKAFTDLGGYDEDLTAGEDPDLSYRVRGNGGVIYRINKKMASHDINLSQFTKFVKRTSRSGYAYVQLARKHGKADPEYFRTIMIRIFGGGLIPPSIILTGLLLGYPFIGLALGLMLALRLVPKTFYFAKLFGISNYKAFQYVLHLAFAVYPQAYGASKVLIGNLFKGTKSQ